MCVRGVTREPGYEEDSSDRDAAPVEPRGKATRKRKKTSTKEASSKEDSSDSDGARVASQCKAAKRTGKGKKGSTPAKKKGSTPAKTKGISNAKGAASPEAAMKWNPALTAIAMETRYKNNELRTGFMKNKLSSSRLTALWQKAVNIVNERALLEGAYGDLDERVITMSQLKNKIKAVGKLFRKKRKKFLKDTGNKAGDESDEDAEVAVPEDFYINEDEDKLDPSNIRGDYINTLGSDIAPVWPLICECLNRVGCTGEPLVETGRVGRTATPVSSDTEENESDENKSDESDEGEDVDDSVKKARAKAKSKAKAKKKNAEPQRPIDVVSSTLKGGFEMIEKAFTSRSEADRPTQSSQQLADAMQALAASLARSEEQQRARAERSDRTNLLLVESMQNIQNTSHQKSELLARLLAKFD